MITQGDIEELKKAATESRARAYAPYSTYQVGAAIRTSTGQIFSGCNVENSSFGATVCAERVAIQTAIAQTGPLQIVDVFVLTDATPPWPPCGMCRQVIAEFADPKLMIHTSNLAGIVHSVPFSKLFPNAFTPSHLTDRTKAGSP